MSAHAHVCVCVCVRACIQASVRAHETFLVSRSCAVLAILGSGVEWLILPDPVADGH